MAAASTSLHLLTLNCTVDENWVCQRHLLQFILGKWYRVQCSNLCKLFVNSKFPKRFHCVCVYARIDLLFIIFVCSLYSPWTTIRLLHHFGFVCVLILGYPVRILRANDAKYVMFHVGWRKSLKGSMTPGVLTSCFLCLCVTRVMVWTSVTVNWLFLVLLIVVLYNQLVFLCLCVWSK